jgi:predicted membrane-bound spermidine synthase
LAATAFLVSGAAGLVYQVAWQRILALHSGVGIYSVAMIVASFMAGLGLGSHVGGRLSVGLTPSSALRAFGLLELSIGAFGAASARLYYDLLYLKAAWLYAPAWRAGVLHFLGLLLPTALMGMTLPLLVRALVRDVPSAGRIIGLLYGINVLGASVGALLTPWVLVRFYGIRGAILVAAAGNALSGLTAVLLSRRRLEAPVGSGSAEGSPATGAAGHPLSLWIALYTLSGFCALSLEIVWFRMLELAVKASSFTFGTLLALYLLGNAGGCLTAVARRKRFARPLRTFLFCQCLLLIWSGTAVALVAFLPESAPGFNWFYRYWVRGTAYALGQPGALEGLLRVYVAFPLFLFGLPAALMGFSFPALQQAVQDDPRQSGRRVGILQAANIAGCVAGSLLLGLLGLTAFGTTGSLRLLMLAGLAFALVGIRTGGARLFAPLAALLVLSSFAVPGQDRLWGRLHGRKAGPDAFFDEDATGVAAIGRTTKTWIVYVNGKGHSWIPFGRVHSMLGAVPALVHPAPRDVAIIGLGSGDTAWAAGCRPQTASVRVFEIAGPQPRLLRRLAAQEDLPDLRRFLADPRVRITIADGRNAVIQAQHSFDLIEADALWPDVAYSGNLYSVEFFEGCARKLKSGGVMCTWAPTDRVYRTFTSVFPHVIANRNRGMLIGSKDPLPVETAAWQRRLAEPAVVDYLGTVRPIIEQMLGELAPVNVKGRRRRELELNRDLFPRDEFRTP